MRLLMVNMPLFLLFLFSAPTLFIFLPNNIAFGGLITLMIAGFKFCIIIEGPSFTRLFKKHRDDGEPIFRSKNQSLVLGVNRDCIAQYPAGSENLLAWLDGPEQWPLLTIHKKTRFFPWYQVEKVSLGLPGKDVLFKFEGGQELKWLPENEDERIRLFKALHTITPVSLDFSIRKTFQLIYSGLIWLVFPFIIIGIQVFCCGAGWMDQPKAQNLAPKAGKADGLITLVFNATHFITRNIPEILWLPTGLIIAGLAFWLLWKIIRKNADEFILTRINYPSLNPDER